MLHSSERQMYYSDHWESNNAQQLVHMVLQTGKPHFYIWSRLVSMGDACITYWEVYTNFLKTSVVTSVVPIRSPNVVLGRRPIEWPIEDVYISVTCKLGNV